MKLKRFLSAILIAAFLAACGCPEPAHAATNAQSIEFLLSQVRASGTVLAGGKVYFYAAGTTTPKTVWLNRSKQTVAANPYTLDGNGTAQLYGDGVYRIVIKDSAGVTKYDRDNLSFRDASGYVANVADYTPPTLATAIASIGSTPTTLEYSTNQTLTGNLTVPATIELRPVNGARIIAGVYTVSGLSEVNPLMFGTDKAAFQTAVNSLVPGGKFIVTPGTYTIANTTAISSSTAGLKVQIDGDIVSTSILANVFEFTGEGVKVSGKGSITGPGTFLDTNSADPGVQWLPSLLKLAGDNSECVGLTFIDHPTNALWLAGSKSKAVGNAFKGGPLTHGTGTVQMYIYSGVASSTKTGNVISGNHFLGDGTVGAAYTGVYNLASDTIITGNYGTGLLEHGVYNYGSNVTISNNQFHDGVAGENLAASIQSFGASDVFITGNISDGALGYYITGTRSTIINNRVNGGIIAVRTNPADNLDPPSITYSDIKIIGNYVMNAPSTQSPIDVTVSNLIDGMTIKDNTTSGGSVERGSIHITRNGYNVAVDGSIKNIYISDNTTVGGLYGVWLYGTSQVAVSGGTVTDPASAGLRAYESTNVHVDRLRVVDTNGTPLINRIVSADQDTDGNSNISVTNCDIVNPSGVGLLNVVPLTSYLSGNGANGLKPSGKFTMTNVATVFIDSSKSPNAAAIAPFATIQLYPLNRAAINLQSGANRLYATTDSTPGRFAVATDSGATAGTTSPIFRWEAIQ